MSSKAFEIAAAVMSYWFAAVMVYLLLRLLQSVWRDYAADRVRRRQAEGYSMGMLEVIAPADDRKGRKNSLYGARFALRRENLIGSAAKCDIRLKDRSVAAVQASVYQKGNQVLLSDYGARSGVFVNGHRVKNDLPLLDGDEISLGDVVLRLHIKGGTAAPAGSREGFEKQKAPAFSDDLYLGGANHASEPEAVPGPEEEEEASGAPWEDGGWDEEEWEDGGYGQRRRQRWETGEPQEDDPLESDDEYSALYGEDDLYDGEMSPDDEYDEIYGGISPEDGWEDEAPDGKEEPPEESRRRRFGRRGGR